MRKNKNETKKIIQRKSFHSTPTPPEKRPPTPFHTDNPSMFSFIKAKKRGKL